MLNIDDFIKRLEQVMLFYGLSGGAFADRIGIQRSSLSHLLSGRNKPSLEFVMKIVSVLPEVDLNWILNGVGVFPKSNQKIYSSPTPTAAQPAAKLLFDDDEPVAESKTLFNNESNKNVTVEKQSFEPILDINPSLTIENIVIFYTDGTFLDYKRGNRAK
ncbi:MAG: helix-turn-helix transcriptional regulator [Flavobacterium sp.]|nr:helix-turn-helix transcriptional regulator [Flavobacterium sp.]